MTLIKWLFYGVFLFVLAQGIHNFGQAHGGFRHMLQQFEDELMTTAQLALHQSTSQMRREAQSYTKDFE